VQTRTLALNLYKLTPEQIDKEVDAVVYAVRQESANYKKVTGLSTFVHRQQNELFVILTIADRG
jgi:hypothetical protein